jgi:TPR repeat protein
MEPSGVLSGDGLIEEIYQLQEPARLIGVEPVIGRFEVVTMNRTTMIAGGAAIAVAVVAALIFLTRPPSESGAVSGADRAEDAREFIADVRKPGPESYADAYDRAREYQKDGRLADAQLLYFYAARGGHAGAEFELAAMNDPNHHDGATSLLAEPDAFQAYKWYSAALEHGTREAQSRLDALHAWATKEAAQGNSEAERLLLQWSR